MTPKQTLKAHFAELHQRVTVRESMTMRELQAIHARQHHRFTPKNHLHWNGTKEDGNLGPTQRPRGWKTGEDVIREEELPFAKSVLGR